MFSICNINRRKTIRTSAILGERCFPVTPLFICVSALLWDGELDAERDGERDRERLDLDTVDAMDILFGIGLTNDAVEDLGICNEFLLLLVPVRLTDFLEANDTKVFMGENRHWRKIDQTLCSFIMSKKIINNYYEELISMCKFEHYPFEKPLHNIYKKELCISPIPSLSVHFTNINSIYGLSPNVDWKKLWEENES